MKFVSRGSFLVALACVSVIAAPAAAQSFGDRVTCTSTPFVCSAPSATVGTGVEFLYGPTASPFLNLDFSNNMLNITSRVANIQLGSNQSIMFRDTTNAFTSAVLQTNTNSTLTASDIVFNNGLLTVNVGSRTFRGTGQLSIALATLAPAVPEPAVWSMMIAGFGLVGFALRRQRPNRNRVRLA